MVFFEEPHAMSLVKNLTRNYPGWRGHPGFTLEIPEWEIADRGITALSGPSGSGKTSVFRVLIGLEPCPGLTWTFQGTDLAQLPPPERRLGVVFQSLELFPHLTAEENIFFAARARKMPAQETNQKLSELVKDLSLENCLHRKAALLSGGEAQRAALARAVIANPRFLFLDEPFSSLDSELKGEARALVKRVIARLEIPTLLVTHDADDLKALADQVVQIRSGRLI
jgi:ABC-type sugar transport system ATPase subunit